VTDEKTLPQARRTLTDAVHRLTAPQHRHIAGKPRTAPSLYYQLCAEIAGTQGENHAPPKSMPPLWIDAAQLIADIDRQARRWEPGPDGTVSRLRVLADKTWRPQDTDLVFSMSITVTKWCNSIDALLDPVSVKDVAAACPACGAKHIYRTKDGERVRQAALQIVTETGCTCQACDAHWGPERLLFLCKLLGFELPAGVME
jgi:predicted RNA-binding Zn-ribbon protein involved in translation (DUF1610 family)